MRRAALLLTLLGCSSTPGVSVPADRPILSWSGTSATDANKKLLPHGFTGPDERACAADTTRVYLGELFKNGIDDAEVLWHWAPIVGGSQAATPTLGQPEFSLAGTLAEVDDSGDDVLTDHPFGLDLDADVAPDPDYAFLPFEHLRSTLLHTEVEARIFPRDALGYAPQAGDRTVMRGVWVLDCGHPPYGAEMHPPTFLGYARPADDRTTIAAAVVVPYRSSLLFSTDPALATAFANTSRFGVGKPFPQALVETVEEAVLVNKQNLATHAMMTANRFDSLDFLVCAPLPKPAGASLQASWRFTSRTGVQVQATKLESAGCVRFAATMDTSYTPAALQFTSAEWPWQALSDSASMQLGVSIDVRKAILDALQQKGFGASSAKCLQEDHPPLVDAYAALQTRAGANLDAPTQIDSDANDQPFPFYGRARVGWSAK